MGQGRLTLNDLRQTLKQVFKEAGTLANGAEKLGKEGTRYSELSTLVQTAMKASEDIKPRISDAILTVKKMQMEQEKAAQESFEAFPPSLLPFLSPPPSAVSAKRGAERQRDFLDAGWRRKRKHYAGKTFL